MGEMIAGAVITMVSFMLGCVFMVLVSAATRRGGDDG